MRINISPLSLKLLTSNQSIATIFLVMMCVQIVAIEGYDISLVKVGLMASAPLIYIVKTPYINRAFIWGMAYWVCCYFIAAFNGEMRFSTVGYLGMFVIMYIVYYNLVNMGAFSLKLFTRLLRTLILAYGIVLVLQQIAIIVGIHSFALINLDNQFFLSLTKLPSLSLEPSHSARLLSVMMLGYIRCLEVANKERLITLKVLFERNHRWVTILFLWAMFTMGSATAFIGLAIISLCFLRKRTLVYVVPLIVIFFYIGQTMGLQQMERALSVVRVTTTGDVEAIQAEDGSAASRIIPIINTLTIDLTQKESWFGKGVFSKEYVTSKRMRNTDKTAVVVEQYGLIALFLSLILVYTCMIRKIFSIETLLFLFLFGFSLGNMAYVWGTMLVFTGVRFFQVQREKGYLNVDNNEN